MPPNIAGITMEAFEAHDEMCDPDVIVYVRHGSLDEDGVPDWGYAMEDANPAAYVARLHYALGQWLEDDPDYAETVRVVEVVDDGAEGEAGAALVGASGGIWALSVNSVEEAVSHIVGGDEGTCQFIDTSDELTNASDLALAHALLYGISTPGSQSRTVLQRVARTLVERIEERS